MKKYHAHFDSPTDDGTVVERTVTLNAGDIREAESYFRHCEHYGRWDVVCEVVIEDRTGDERMEFEIP